MRKIHILGIRKHNLSVPIFKLSTFQVVTVLALRDLLPLSSSLNLSQIY